MLTTIRNACCWYYTTSFASSMLSTPDVRLHQILIMTIAAQLLRSMLPLQCGLTATAVLVCRMLCLAQVAAH